MLLFTLLACTGAPSDDTAKPIADDGCVHPRWADGLPFPSNRFVTRDATSPTGIRLAIDDTVIPPSRNDAPPLEASWFDGIDGFSRIAPVVVRIDAPLDPSAFPALSEDGTAPIFVLDTETNAIVPGRVAVTDDATITLWPDRKLAANRLHAIVLRSDLPTSGTCFSAGPDILAAEAAGDELADELAQARAAAAAAGLAEADVAAAIPFRTRSEAGESATLRAIEGLAPTLVSADSLTLDDVVDCAQESDDWCGAGVAFVVRGEAALPTWQGADRMFEVDADGVPTVQGSEDVRFWFLVPEAARTAPVPYLVLQHGLGSKRTDLAGFGQSLAAGGHAVVAIDAVAHGDRPSEDDVTLTFFGIDFDQWLVPVARDNIRQTAADHLALRALFATVTAEDGTFAGQPFHLDAEDATYVGQSLGGIIGATSCAMDTGLDRCVLNVPGGRLVEVVRANAAYATLMNIYFDPSDQASEVELFTALAQTLVDPADPALNGPRILHESPARPVLVQEATDDATVANQTTEVLARSMEIPLLLPSIEDIHGLGTEDMPVSANVDGLTAGLTQFDAEHGFLTYGGGAEGERALRQILTFLSEDRIEPSEAGE